MSHKIFFSKNTENVTSSTAKHTQGRLGLAQRPAWPRGRHPSAPDQNEGNKAQTGRPGRGYSNSNVRDCDCLALGNSGNDSPFLKNVHMVWKTALRLLWEFGSQAWAKEKFKSPRAWQGQSSKSVDGDSRWRELRNMGNSVLRMPMLWQLFDIQVEMGSRELDV